MLRLALPAALAAAMFLMPHAVPAVVIGHSGFDEADLNLMAHHIAEPRRLDRRFGTFGIMSPAAMPDVIASGRRARYRQRRLQRMAVGQLAERIADGGQGNVFMAAGLNNQRQRHDRDRAEAQFDFAFGDVVALQHLTIDMAALGDFGPSDMVRLTLSLDGETWSEPIVLTSGKDGAFAAARATDAPTTEPAQGLDAPLIDGYGNPVHGEFRTLTMVLAGAQARTASILFEAVMGRSGTAFTFDNITFEAVDAVPLPPTLGLLALGGLLLWTRSRQRC
ncbi:MAG: hypothetical protein AAF577_04535 [Pseudomonadota bacterium]